MPKTGDAVAALPPCEVEDECLLMPSELTEAMRSKLDVSLISAEIQLREGEANDALRDLRSAIKYTSALRQQKKINVRGQKPNTRAQVIIKDGEAKKDLWVQKYRHAQSCLAALNLPDIDSKYPKLLDKDMYMKSLTEPHELGSGRETEGWIWRSGPIGNLSETEQAEWDLDAERVRWFREKADRDRWQEEVDILEEEFRRTIRSFQKMSATWDKLADQNSEKGGYVAYARRQAAMFKKMEVDCSNRFTKAAGPASEVVHSES
ncbi:hypothetical protein BD410DRAFT_846611 [Rickenella mellea]|uniref:Uncharacterized protein n=1 Tax=Rickenella mellea TaxID=50990 RepID=A0A4Y7PEV9_9AGAM|nr:hypothetical protein BD410DRAFT_846611 [Rickenella mellea]